MKKKTIEKLKFEKHSIILLNNLISINGGVSDNTGGLITDKTIITYAPAPEFGN